MNQLPNLIVFMMLAFLSLILLMNMPDSAPDWMAIVVRSSARQDVTHSAPLGRRSFLLCRAPSSSF